MKKGNYKYQLYTGIVSNTVPGRCYSIAELLQRVMRGQPLPQVGKYEEDLSNPSTKDINAQIDSLESRPDKDRDFDEIDAFDALSDVNNHIDLFNEEKEKKSN